MRTEGEATHRFAGKCTVRSSGGMSSRSQQEQQQQQQKGRAVASGWSSCREERADGAMHLGSASSSPCHSSPSAHLPITRVSSASHTRSSPTYALAFICNAQGQSTGVVKAWHERRRAQVGCPSHGAGSRNRASGPGQSCSRVPPTAGVLDGRAPAGHRQQRATGHNPTLQMPNFLLNLVTSQRIICGATRATGKHV